MIRKILVHQQKGPYSMYAHASASSILRKAEDDSVIESYDFESAERTMEQLSQYAENATCRRAMSHIISVPYLYETSQVFNRFYENNKVIGSARQAIRIAMA